MQQISDFDTHTLINLENPPAFHRKILQNCPRRIAADVRKMKVYNCTRNDLSRYRIDADISKLVKKRIWSQSLDLHLSNRENINLARALPYLKKLTFLSVDFSSELGANPNIDSSILLLLSKILYCLKNLRTLRLNLKSCKKFPEKSIKSFASKLRKCSTLKKVALNIESSGGLDNSFLYLSHAISKLNYLEDFKINMDNFKISNHGLVTSLNSVAACTTLTQLCIGLHLSAKYDVTTHVAKSLPKMKQLTKLKLDFSFCLDIEDKGIIALSKSLVNLTNLNRLELSFQRCLKVTDKGVIVLGESIKDLSKLRQLRLLLLNCSGVTDSSIKVVAQNVILLSELYQFHFGFGHWPNVSDVCFNEVLTHLSTASQLKDLRIAFEAQSPQSEGGLITIGENLVNYKNLVKLSVKFISRFITDKVLQIFAQNIEHMKQLTHLKLNFNGKSRITDNGIKFLSQGLGHLPQLSVFEITLIQPKSFSEPGLVALMQGLGRYNQELTSLRIICHFCEGIDDNALLSLGDRLFKINSLRFLKLIFFACSNITDVGLEGLSKSITQNPHHIQAYLDCILCPKLSEKGNLILREFKDK